MSEIILCSGCQHKLQVPEQYLGQTVQCPECGHMFVASATTVSAVPAAPPPSAAKPRPFDDDDDDYPTRRRRRFEDDDDDDFDDIDAHRRVRHHHLPHRGGLIMTLGLVSLIGGWMCWFPVIVGPFAWVMGTMDLREIRAGRMDPSGEGMVRTGQVCGIISTVIMFGVLLLIGFIVLAGMQGF